MYGGLQHDKTEDTATGAIADGIGFSVDGCGGGEGEEGKLQKRREEGLKHHGDGG